MEQCLADYQAVSQKVDKQIDELNENRKQMLSDVEVFRKLYDQNLVHLCKVNARLRALEGKLKHLEEKVRPKIAKKAESYGDPSSRLQLEDLSYQVAGLERRVRDLNLTRDICIQCAGQIRLAQFDRQALAERIVDLVMNVVPLWKTQVSIALAKNRQKETLKLQQRILQATTQVLKRNAAMLKSGRDDSARDAKLRPGMRPTDDLDEEPRSTTEASAALPVSDTPQPRPRPASSAVTHMKPLPDGLDH
jgi:uncharacterized protein YaaN involved in tellurite resistance